MDISSITPTERPFDIKHPKTGESIGLTVTLLPDSDQKVVTARRKYIDERMQRTKKMTASAYETLQTNLIVAAVNGWEWGKDANGDECSFHGEKPEFSEATLRRVLKELPWIKSALDQEIGDEASFY